MRKIILMTIIGAGLGTSYAFADIPVTPQQHTMIESKLTSMGCTGGYMQFDPSDNHFEVNNTTCNGRVFDITLSKNLELLEKDLED